jgi:prepilin-type N-terminal cleavage/methylation domain-containing protein/prepilin-type processing-associated H-X9-DG protein
MRQSPAFTLVELLVVVAIIVILLGISAPAMQNAMVFTDLVTCKSNLEQLGIASTMYIAEHRNRFMPFRKWIVGNYTDIRALTDPNRSLIFPYIQNADFFLCPTFKQVCASNAIRSYVMQHSFGCTEWYWNERGDWANGYSLDKPSHVKDPARLGIITEEATWKVQVDGTWYSRYQVNDAHLVCPDWPNRDTIAQFHMPGPGPIDQQIEGVGNVVFVDGHVEHVLTTQTPYVVSQNWY